MNINKLLVKRLQVSGEEAVRLINAKRVLIDGKIATQKQTVLKDFVIKVDEKVIQDGKQFFYVAYHKPRGIESTQNTAIPNNLADAVKLDVAYFPLGRLDKESEGLMILTNDGSIYREVTSAKVEKEYLVEVDKEITDELILQLASGVEILGQKTLPCDVTKIDIAWFRIVLKQGLNRQIRRMCYKLGYDVLTLKRIRIGGVMLDDLQPNVKTEISKNTILK